MALIGFDLDGTLVDPLGAVRSSLDRACAAQGLAPVAEEVVRAHIGPGIRALFHSQAWPEAVQQTLWQEYWSLYRQQGLPLHRPYDGIQPMLHRLKHAGHTLVLVTAKPVTITRELLHLLDLGRVFEAVFGSDIQDPDSTKTSAMSQFADSGLLTKGGVYVGDRGSDMVLALAKGLLPCGVTWGYGSRQELLEAGARMLFEDAPSLEDWLMKTWGTARQLDSFSLAE